MGEIMTAAVVGKSGSLVLPLEIHPPLSISTTIDDTVDVSVLITIGTIVDESEVQSEATLIEKS